MVDRFTENEVVAYLLKIRKRKLQVTQVAKKDAASYCKLGEVIKVAWKME